MQRDKWEFSYTADKLAEAAKVKLAHHQERLSWWTDQKAKLMERIRAEGLEIDESLTDLYSNKMSGGRSPTVQVRGDLMRDLRECVEKTHEHANRVAGYDGWVQVLASQGQAAVKLHHDDWLFFFSSPKVLDTGVEVTGDEGLDE